MKFQKHFKRFVQTMKVKNYVHANYLSIILFKTRKILFFLILVFDWKFLNF